MADSHSNIVGFNEVSGGWIHNYSLYYEHAWELVRDYHNLKKQLIALENELRKKPGLNEDEPHFESWISHETSELSQKLELVYTSCILYSCMSIEGFINFYGVKRLGEKNYKKNIERIGITEKFNVLIMICFGIMPDHNAPLLKSLRTLFDVRNSLVHPKTKEMNFEKTHFNNTKLEITTVEETLKLFADHFCEIDSKIKKEFYFKNA